PGRGAGLMDTATIREAINQVVDPCSAGRGVAIGLTDMGLVRDVRIRREGGRVEVEVDMRVTSPGCMFAVEFDAQIRHHLRSLGADRVLVDWDAETLDWSPADIEPSARHRLVGYRARMNQVIPDTAVPLTVIPVAS